MARHFHSGLPHEYANLVVVQRGEHVALRLVHHVRAEVLADDHVPRFWLELLVEVGFDFTGDLVLLLEVVEGLQDLVHSCLLHLVVHVDNLHLYLVWHF